MGFISWLVEEVADFFSSDDASEKATSGLVGGAIPAGSGGLDFVDPMEGGAAVTPGFVDPLAEGRQIIDSDPVLANVQATMDKAGAIYREAMGTDHVPSSVESTQQLISGVMNASPEQLDRMSMQLEGMNAEADIRQSVAESEAALRESNANHQAIIDANAAEIEAQARIAEAEALIDKTNRDLGSAY